MDRAASGQMAHGRARRVSARALLSTSPLAGSYFVELGWHGSLHLADSVLILVCTHPVRKLLVWM
jgi:hypothetical protein